MRKFHSPAALLPAVIGCTSIFAADDSAVPVIITATRTAQSADATLASVTVITREDLERTQSATLQDALRNVVGLSLDNNGGAGKATSVFLRGTESDHVLVLIDGVKAGSATLGTTAFQDIPVEHIDRIEVVRGPRSSLYGSEAIGGVIQIFTRRGHGPMTPSFSAGAGSHDTAELTAGISGGDAENWLNVNLSTSNTRGINACSGNPSGGGCFTNEPDADGYRNHAATLRAGHRFASGVEMEATALRAQGHNEFDGSSANETDFAQQALGGQLRFSPLGFWHATLRGGQSRDDSNNLLDGTKKNTFHTRRDSLSLQNDISPAENQIATLGIDYQNDSVGGSTRYTAATRNNTGIFLQYQIGWDGHDLQLSVRGDDNQRFNNQNTYGLMWGHDLAPGVRLKASYGTAFKAPTFNELYYPGFGNPALLPEKSRSGEIGIDGRAVWGRWSIAAYQSRVSDLIAFDATTYAPENIAAARIVGVESTLSARLAEWTLNLNATLLHPENRATDANRGNALPRRAEEIANLDISHRIGAINLGAALHAEGRRYDDLANTNKLGGYATLDVRGEYVFMPQWLLQARVSNLLDKQYVTARYFNQDGSNFLLTLRYQPTPK